MFNLWPRNALVTVFGSRMLKYRTRYCRKLPSSLHEQFGQILGICDLKIPRNCYFLKGKRPQNPQIKPRQVVPRCMRVLASDHGRWHICHDLVMAERRLRSAKLSKSWLGDTAGWLWEATWAFCSWGEMMGRQISCGTFIDRKMYGHVGKGCKLVCSFEMFIVCPRLFHFAPVYNTYWIYVGKTTQQNSVNDLPSKKLSSQCWSWRLMDWIFWRFQGPYVILVGGLEHVFIFPNIGNFIIQLTFIFSEGLKTPTSIFFHIPHIRMLQHTVS